ncbi:MAG: conjugal transfer protein TraF [Erysipelotrichaceae bacterium]
MKKIALFGLALMLFVTGCSQNKGEIVKKNSTEVMTMLESDPSMMLVIGSSTCSACIAYEEVMKEFTKNNEATIYELLIDEEPTEEVDGKQTRTGLIKLMEIIGEVTATPTTFWIVEGKVERVDIGVLDYRTLKDRFAEYYTE